MSAPLQVAVVGLGIGSQHALCYRALPERFELRAVCDIDEKRARALAEKHDVPEVFTDFDSLLARGGLDVIDICTPPHLHFEQARAALVSGHHVICEKPLVPSLSLADRLIEIEAESGRRLMPIFQYRFGRGLMKFKHLVDCGIAGRAYQSLIETAWLRGSDYYAVDWRRTWQGSLGGVLVQHAIHAHDLLCHVVGPVKSAFARATTRVNPVETEDCAGAVLEMADGSIAVLSATLGARPELSRLRFCFENMTAESSLAPYVPAFEPWSLHFASPEIERRSEQALRDFDPGHEWYTGQFARFYDALADGSEFPVTLADARASLELISALYHSVETGRPEKLPIGREHPSYASWLPA